MATRERVGMRLLVSVAGPDDARAALAGGADVIDAKDPGRGALGPVSADALAAIRRTVGPARPLSAALGDARAVDAIERAARAVADFAAARGLDADVVGVRGAACRGGRRGPVSQARVAALSALARTAPRAPLGVFP